MDPNQHPIITAILTAVFNVGMLAAVLVWFRKRLETYLDSYLGEKGKIQARVEDIKKLMTEVHSLAIASEKGKNLARSEDIEKLVAEVRALTKASETIKTELQSLFSRISKVHEREFEVLPKAWFTLHEAVGSAFGAVSGIRVLTNLDAMPDDQYAEFIENSELMPYQKKRLAKFTGPERSIRFSEENDVVALRNAFEKHRVFNNYLIEHRIFMSKDLHAAFNEFVNDLRVALQEYSDPKSILLKDNAKLRII